MFKPSAKSKKKMISTVSSLKDYMAKYDSQPCYETYSEETFIDDVLYGLGIALDPTGNAYAGGFDKFKERLLAHLQPNSGINRSREAASG